MLKRLQNKRTAHQSTLPSPVFLETTLDDTVYHDQANVDASLSHEVDWEPQDLITKRPTAYTNKTRPPPESLHLSVPQKSQYRPASSVYSQPSPNIPIEQYQRDTIYTDDIEISPPSSPDSPFNVGRTYNSRGEELVSPIEEENEVVSPIEEEAEETQDTQNPQVAMEPETPTHRISAMRREKRKNEAAAQLAQARKGANAGPVNGNGLKKNSAAPKYDPYTGEPTTDERKGKPQSVKPSTFHAADKPVHDNSDPRMGTKTLVSSTVPVNKSGGTTFTDRLRKLRDKNVIPEERPPWKGSSGRQSLIAPPTEPSNPKTFSVPKKTNRRVTEPERLNPLGLHTVTETDNSITAESEEMHPAFRGKNLYERRFPKENTSLPSEYRIPTQDFRAPKGFVRKEMPNLPEPTREPTPPQIDDLEDISVGSVERNFREALKESNLVSNYPEGQLPSKFSVTTYDPSTYQNTPRPSTDENNHHWDPVSAPPLPTASPNPEETPSPVVTRRRPRVNSIDTTKSSIIPARKPVPTAPNSPAILSPTISIHRDDKQLPLTPGERAAQNQDLISKLQAQTDELRRRRQNLENAIRQMTELMPQDGLMGGLGGALVGGGNTRNYIVGGGGPGPNGQMPYLKRGASVMTKKFTEKRREEEKLKVEELKRELGDIRVKEHETGLKLHRAYKRSEAPGHVPSHLWVRRVTG